MKVEKLFAMRRVLDAAAICSERYDRRRSEAIEEHKASQVALPCIEHSGRRASP